MGRIRDRIREACEEYCEDRNLYRFVTKLADITDYSIRYQWLREHFDVELKKAFEEIINDKYRKNPSHRTGNV